MKNMFIPYELAVKAYEKRFEIKSYGIGWYYKRRSTGDIHGLDTFYIDTNQNIEQWESIDEPIEAILYQQILDWLRENHNLCIYVMDATHNGYFYQINNHKTRFNVKGSSEVLPYYEALNTAIEEALKLI
ncbi:MAG: hypothetical protein IPJ01_10130 [Micavibrio sp.]|nr:hypothetical protein [Micavibrio sp.]